MSTEPVDLRNANSIWQYLVNLLFVSQLRLIHGYRLLLCYSLFLLFFGRLLQIFNFHSKPTFLFRLFSLPHWDNVNAWPDFSESTRAQLFLAEVLATDVLVSILLLLRFCLRYGSFVLLANSSPILRHWPIHVVGVSTDTSILSGAHVASVLVPTQLWIMARVRPARVPPSRPW